ncbi:MAG TPA: acyclic terpene utilization AtuA family protein [Beijerinckiaceae bacterium]|nr:acyclic terpene utilization AtuA family protein [Beijerinckiaceae bacterium]
MQQTVFIGAGAGFAGDCTDAAGPVAEAMARSDGSRFLIFETLAERTLALAQVERRRDPACGYNPLLEAFVGPVLRTCLENKIRIVSNFGAANPRGAAMRICEMGREAGFPGILVAVVEGDDLTGALSPQEFAARETGGSLLADGPAIVAANVYLGAAPIADGLSRGADVVVTGRVADPSLALGPLIHAFGWAADDWDRLAAGTLVGHLLECGAQVTGGYFADPGVKDVPGMDAIGYPIAEVEADGSFVITKPDGTGGLVDRRTVTEQVLYEIHDPAAYLTPDVVLDLTEVELREIGPDRVRLHGARGRPAPETLKATVCFDGGLLGEAEISYAGPNAAARARLAIDTVRARVARRAPGLALRADAVGVVSILGDSAGGALAAGWRDGADVRVRFAAAGHDAGEIELVMGEVEALYCAGPAGGAGVRRRITPRLASASCLIERKLVRPAVTFVGGAA